MKTIPLCSTYWKAIITPNVEPSMQMTDPQESLIKKAAHFIRQNKTILQKTCPMRYTKSMPTLQLD